MAYRKLAALVLLTGWVLNPTFGQSLRLTGISPIDHLPFYSLEVPVGWLPVPEEQKPDGTEAFLIVAGYAPRTTPAWVATSTTFVIGRFKNFEAYVKWDLERTWKAHKFAISVIKDLETNALGVAFELKFIQENLDQRIFYFDGGTGYGNVVFTSPLDQKKYLSIFRTLMESLRVIPRE